MNSRTLLLAATALTFAPLARAEDASVNELTTKVLAILNSPAGQEELNKQLQALSAALKANGQGDLNDAIAKLETQLDAGSDKTNAAAMVPSATPGDATPAPAAAPAGQPAPPQKRSKTAPAPGLQTSHLQSGSLQSGAQGLTSPEEWQRMFSK